MIIRAATLADADSLRRIELAAADSPGQLVSWPEDIAGKDYPALVAELLHNGIILVAERTGAVIGHAYLDRMSMPALSHIVRLTTVVARDQVGAGVGTALLGRLIEIARQQPWLRKIELLVRATNEPAIRLYRRHGFVEEGVLRDRVRTPTGAYIDDLAMALRISR